MRRYTVTRSRQGLIGVSIRSLTANRLGSSKAAKKPPSHIELINLFDWLAMHLTGKMHWKITGRGSSSKIPSLTSIALRESPEALADVMAQLNGIPCNDQALGEVVLYLHEMLPNALCSSLLSVCVSGCRCRDPTIMLSGATANDNAHVHFPVLNVHAECDQTTWVASKAVTMAGVLWYEALVDERWR